MAVTDLTGYTWVGREILNMPDNAEYDINFTSNNTSYVVFNPHIEIIEFAEELLSYITDNLSSINAYYNGWTNSAYKTIVITGGADVTNATLISWLEANGTLTAPVQPTAKTVINGLTPIKKMIGNTEVVKEVLNGVTVYEKQASGYTVTLNANTTYLEEGHGAEGYCKINSAPENNSDYDFYWYASAEGAGNQGTWLVYGSQSRTRTLTLQDVSTLYCWEYSRNYPSTPSNINVMIGNDSLINTSYDNPLVLSITEDTTKSCTAKFDSD